MKFLILLPILVLISCSTGKNSQNVKRDTEPVNVTKDTFKKEKVLTTTDVKDFYVENPKSLNPALQDETLDRYSMDEIELLADNKDPLIEIAIRCSKRDFDNALSVAGKVFHRYQKIPAYWNIIANCHLNQRSNRKALLFYNKALEVSPGYVPALNNIGVLYSRQGEDQKALVAFEKANKQSRFAKTPRYNLARLYLSYGLAESALPLFQGLLNEASGDIDLLNALGSCYFLTGDYQKALLFFRRIPASLARRAEIGLNYSMTLKKSGFVKEAEVIFAGVEKPKTKALKDYYSSIENELGAKL